MLIDFNQPQLTVIDLDWPVLTVFDEVTDKKKASYRSTLRWIKRKKELEMVSSFSFIFSPFSLLQETSLKHGTGC